MAEKDTSPKQVQGNKRFILPAMISTCVISVIGLFTLGYVNLSTPAPVPDDIHAIMAKVKEKAKANAEAAAKEVAEDVLDNAMALPNGTFDFAKYRYYSFPLPYVVNLAGNSGTMTVEISLATFSGAISGEKHIEDLETWNPKMRSAIYFALSDIALDDVDTVEKRRTLEARLLEDVRAALHQQSPDDLVPLTHLYFTKFVLSGAL